MFDLCAAHVVSIGWLKRRYCKLSENISFVVCVVKYMGSPAFPKFYMRGLQWKC